MEWNYYGPFGFTAGLADADEVPYPLDMRVTGELLRQKETALVGRADEVTAALLRMKELVGPRTSCSCATSRCRACAVRRSKSRCTSSLSK
jgi:hypothetical protein